MLLRQLYEQQEESTLSPMATLSSLSKGREREEEPCEVRTVFQRDRDRILHCKAFRRMKHKTQVFIAPEGDHYRTRLTHTLEVAQIARTIARALSLNEDLTEAIALGHDLGHTPFGHSGEHVLDGLTKEGFRHNEQSIRIVKFLENGNKGLNLTHEVLDGILCHPTREMPSTMEGRVVRLADKVAYINHDIDDAMRGLIIHNDELPESAIAVLGNTSKKRIHNMILDIIHESQKQKDVKMSPTYATALKELRQYMFQHVYIGSRAKGQEEKAMKLVKSLFEYYSACPDELPGEFSAMIDGGEKLERVVCDYIAGMTDNYAIRMFCQINLPRPWDIY